VRYGGKVVHTAEYADFCTTACERHYAAKVSSARQSERIERGHHVTLTSERRTIEAPLEHELDPQLQDALVAHQGRWVATTRSEILAVGDSASEVLKAARAAGIESPIVYRVPEDSRTAYFF
jgi:hypothetical protein